MFESSIIDSLIFFSAGFFVYIEESKMFHALSRNHSVACVAGPFSLKSEVSCELCNLKCTVHLIFRSFRRSTVHEDNRDLRFDLGTGLR